MALKLFSILLQLSQVSQSIYGKLNNLLMQFQADVLDVPIVRPTMLETTALGAGLLAGLATGVWSTRDEAKAAWKEDRTFTPAMTTTERDAHLGRWRSAVKRT